MLLIEKKFPAKNIKLEEIGKKLRKKQKVAKICSDLSDFL